MAFLGRTFPTLPFREYKHWVHEGGIATPLIAHWPDRIQTVGALRHQPGQLPDIMATCLEISEAAYPDEHNGTPDLSVGGDQSHAYL